MKKLVAIFLIFSPFYLVANEIEAVKETLIEKQKALVQARSAVEKSALYYELALAFYQDQEVDQAFFHFLESLKGIPTGAEYRLSEKESALYTEALEDYLARSVSDPIQAAQMLLQKYGEAADQNRHFVYLNFLMATAYANLGKYEDFFERFYKGYGYLHDSFLAYKTKGILYLRLSHHGKSAEERQLFQKEAFDCLTIALNRNSQDSSLYKVLIFLAKDEKKNALILSYLQKMVDNKVELPRSDIFFYVREAVLLGALELGQAIIDRGRTLYEYSRSITAAQEYLNQQGGHARSDSR